ncbi:MAG: hypothetical protein SF097_22200 [Acidobacteriota bacterium]|nr:hypothetical protein [Acidobacteriota bacterium]
MRKTAILFLMICACCLYSFAIAQWKLEHLKKWAGEYPTYGKKYGNFFRLPEIEQPLKKLLTKKDFLLLTKGHKKEMPIDFGGEHLNVEVCGANDCAGCCRKVRLRINLKSGSLEVTFYEDGQAPREYKTK